MTRVWADNSHAMLGLATLLVAAAAVLIWLRRYRPHNEATQSAFRRVGSFALDPRRRLHLIEIDGQRALVLTGGANDFLIAWPCRSPTA